MEKVRGKQKSCYAHARLLSRYVAYKGAVYYLFKVTLGMIELGNYLLNGSMLHVYSGVFDCTDWEFGSGLDYGKAVCTLRVSSLSFVFSKGLEVNQS